MAPRVWDFQIDEFNEAEMAEHDVTPEEVWQVLNSKWRVFRNHGPQADAQPYVLSGVTEGGRLLHIPIQPIEPENGLWRPATAFTP